MIQKNIRPRASNPPLCKEVISEKNSNKGSNIVQNYKFVLKVHYG